MLKVLIVCKSSSTIKTITNKILSDLTELQIIGMANEFNEAKELIFKHEPDIIITTSSNIIKFLEDEIHFYTPKIVIISKADEIYTDHDKMLILNYNLKFKEIANHILKFVQESISNSKREKAKKILMEVGFSFKLTGTVYLLDSILYACTYKGGYSFEQLKRDVYSYVAKINKTNQDRVKWSINRAINTMFSKHTQKSYEVIEKYFGIEYPKKPTAKLIISMIANNLII